MGGIERISGGGGSKSIVRRSTQVPSRQIRRKLERMRKNGIENPEEHLHIGGMVSETDNRGLT